MIDDSLWKIYIYIYVDGYDTLNDCAMFEIDVLMANIDASIYLLPLLHHEIYYK